MITNSKSLEPINRFLLKTEKYQGAFYWVFISLGILSVHYFSGIALPILLISIIGLALYYACLMIDSAKNNWLQINADNNQLLTKYTSDLSEQITRDTQKLQDVIDAHEIAINEKLLQLMNMINNQTREFKSLVENQTATINNCIVSTALQKSNEIIDTLKEYGAQNTEISVAHHKSIMMGIQEAQNLTESNCEKILSTTTVAKEAVRSIVEGKFEQLTNAQITTTLEMKNALLLMDASIIKQSGEIVHKITEDSESAKELLCKSFADMQDNTYSFIKESQVTVVNEVDKKFELLCNCVETSSDVIKETQMSFERNALRELSETKEQVVHTVAHTSKQIQNAILDTCSILKHDSFSLINERVDKILQTIESNNAKLSNAVVENVGDCNSNLSSTISEIDINLSGKLNQLNNDIRLLNQESKECIIDRFNDGFKRETQDLLAIANERSATVNANIDKVSIKISDLSGAIRDQNSSVTNELDKLTNEIIRCITTSLENHSETILTCSDENANNLENTLDSIISKIESISTGISTQFELAKSEFDKVHSNINAIEQIDRECQNTSSKSLHRQEQLSGDIQAITTQLGNIRLLVQSLKSNEKTKSDHKGNIETFEDEANNLKINNIYEGGVLKKSEMYSDNRIKYYVEYDAQGKITYSKNFDSAENVLAENYYYQNEQVKERIEWVKQNGKVLHISSRFDEKGKKLE